MDEIIIENDEKEKIDYDPLLITIQKEMEARENDESNIDCDFYRINMIPRIIDDIIRKEKVSFGYLNHNLLIMFLLLFFNNMIKENCISYFSYYITDKESFIENKDDANHKYILDIKKVKFTCLLTGLAYLSEIISIFFIFPFHRINHLFKKNLIVLMIATNLLMISLSVCLLSNNISLFSDCFFININ